MNELKENLTQEQKESPKTGYGWGIFIALIPAIIGIGYMVVNQPSSGGSLGAMMEGILVLTIGFGFITVSVIIFIIWGIAILVKQRKKDNGGVMEDKKKPQQFSNPKDF